MSKITGNREEIIQSAILDKLGEGISLKFYTADDILTVAEITEAQLNEISAQIAACAQQSRHKAKLNQKKSGENVG